MKLPTVQDVVDNHLCTGCGACAYAFPDRIHMVDTIGHGRRPVAKDIHRTACLEVDAASVCPGLGQPQAEVGGIPELRRSWGTVLEVWEGHAVDPEIRRRGSSGGVTTALALHALEQEHVHGVVHVRARRDAPLLNETVLSKSRAALLEGAGSRYSPASPCEGLSEIATADGPCVFIGKPCDVAGAHKACKQDTRLNRNLGLKIAIFCAGTPSLRGTHELARHLGAETAESITECKYRGNGWPGKMTVSYRCSQSGETTTKSMDYDAGWGNILQRHRQWRCHLCADHTGELADISVGDPWYRPIEPGEPGRSLVLVRTQRGREALARAVAAGYVEMERREASVLSASQPHLLRAQASVWGRSLSCRLAGTAAPSGAAFRQLTEWLAQLGFREKLQSIVGTLRRIRRKRLAAPEAAERYRSSVSLDS